MYDVYHVLYKCGGGVDGRRRRGQSHRRAQQLWRRVAAAGTTAATATSTTTTTAIHPQAESALLFIFMFRNRFWHTLYRSHAAHNMNGARGAAAAMHFWCTSRRRCMTMWKRVPGRTFEKHNISTAMDESHNLNPRGHSGREILRGQAGHHSMYNTIWLATVIGIIIICVYIRSIVLSFKTKDRSRAKHYLNVIRTYRGES